jgi:hypothetical protein
LENDWNLGKGLNGPTPSLCGPAPCRTGSRPTRSGQASPACQVMAAAPPTASRPADSPVCAAIAHPYPLHTSHQRRNHSRHTSLHHHLCPTHTWPAATLCAAPLPLSPVSCHLEPPNRLHVAKTLRRTKLHPWIEPPCHEEGPKLTDVVRFPRHGHPIMDSLLHPPSGPNSTSMSFTPVHCSSLAQQMPPSAAPLAPHW